ncbi:TonB-dependent receptor, partial [Ostertagia ostertagi]
MLDGKHISLQDQAKDVMHNEQEMNNAPADLVKKVMSCKTYRDAFKKFLKYTPEEQDVSISHIVSAITYYYAGFSQYTAPFDDAMNNRHTLTSEEKNGFNLFMSKAQCGTCHFVPLFNGVKPPYIGSEFEVIGVPTDTTFRQLSPDKGRYLVNPAPETMNAFRTGTVYGIDNLYVDNEIYQTPLHGDGFTPIGSASSTQGKYKRYTWSNTLQFDYSFNNVHNVSILAGQEQDRRTSIGFGINRTQVLDPVYTVIQAGWGINNSSGSAYGENYLTSEFGRVNYDYKKKYLLSANLRQDKYSALLGKREVFWGASVGWEITKENFWSSANLDRIFSSFKVRGSYGKVGNTGGINDYATYSTYGSGLYGGQGTLIFNQAGNPNLQWETSKKLDLGLGFGLFKERLTFDFAYYKNDISDLILNVPQSPSAGLPSTVPQNVGTMYNKGVELAITGIPIRTKDFSWTSTLNFSNNKNEVTSLAPGLVEVLGSTSSLETVSRTAVGYPVGYLWVVRSGGVDPASGRRILYNKAGTPILYQFFAPAGQFNYTNPDGTRYNKPDGSANTVNQAADGVMYANPIPKQIGGWDNTFRWKDFE